MSIVFNFYGVVQQLPVSVPVGASSTATATGSSAPVTLPAVSDTGTKKDQRYHVSVTCSCQFLSLLATGRPT